MRIEFILNPCYFV